MNLSSIIAGAIQTMFLYGLVWLLLRSKRMRAKHAKVLRNFADRLEVTRARPAAVLGYFALLVLLGALGTFF
jgi:hypothetical protein